MYVTVDVSIEETGDERILLRLVVHDEIGGTYEVEKPDGRKHDVWLCNVVHFIFGEHPDLIYCKTVRIVKAW